MLFRCKETFETREYGFPQAIREGTVWYRRSDVSVPGGYECANILEVRDGRYTANYARIRIERLKDNFDQIPLAECGLVIPPEQSRMP